MGGLHGLGQKRTDKVCRTHGLSLWVLLLLWALLFELSFSIMRRIFPDLWAGDIGKVKILALMGTQNERSHGPFLSSVSIVQSWSPKSSYQSLHLKRTTIERRGRGSLIAPILFVS